MSTKRIVAGAAALAAFNSLPAHYARIPKDPIAEPSSRHVDARPLAAMFPFCMPTTSGAGALIHKVVTGATVLQAVQSDFGVTLATGVSAWADQSGNGKDYGQATSGKQPAYAQTALNGFPSITTDGVDDSLTSSLNLSTPGTTPTYFCGVVKLKAWTNSRRVIGSTSNGNFFVLFCNSVTPQVALFVSSTVDTVSPTLGLWYRVEAYVSNSASDYNQWGALRATGSAGNVAAATGREIGSAAGTNFSNTEWAFLMYCNALPNERSVAAGGNGKIDGVIRSKYGTAVNF
jgi:hypothetical protein